MSEIDKKIFKLLAERFLNKHALNDWAVKCIEEGFDSRSLRMLAAMPPGQYSPTEFDDKLASTLEELGWNLAAPHEFLLHYARETAQEILDENFDPVDGACEIFGILQRIDAHSELGPWYEIDEMLWERSYFERTGSKGYYYQDEEQLAEEIDRACTDFLKRTNNNPLPLPQTTFHEAELLFRAFLDSLGVNSNIQWIFREDILIDKMQVLIRTPLREDNRVLARDCFELGKQRNLGLTFHAAYLLGNITCCYVQLPRDAQDAQYKLMGDRNLKLSCRRTLEEAKGVSSKVKWLIKEFLTDRPHNRFRLADIPSRNTLLPEQR